MAHFLFPVLTTVCGGPYTALEHLKRTATLFLVIRQGAKTLLLESKNAIGVQDA